MDAPTPGAPPSADVREASESSGPRPAVRAPPLGAWSSASSRCVGAHARPNPEKEVAGLGEVAVAGQGAAGWRGVEERNTLIFNLGILN